MLDRARVAALIGLASVAVVSSCAAPPAAGGARSAPSLPAASSMSPLSSSPPLISTPPASPEDSPAAKTLASASTSTCPATEQWPAVAIVPPTNDRLFVSAPPTTAVVCEYSPGDTSAPPVEVPLTGTYLSTAAILLGSLPPPSTDPACPDPKRSDLLLFSSADGDTTAVRIDPASGCTFAWGDSGVHSSAPAKLLWVLAALDTPPPSAAVASPTTIDEEPYRQPLGLSFPTSKHGVLLAVDCPLLPGNCGLFSQVSDDGGVTWSTRTPILSAHWTEPGDSPFEFGSEGLAFASESVGYAYAGAGLYKTTDGGHTWAHIATVDGQVSDVVTAGSSTWVAVLHGCGDGGCTGWELDTFAADGHLAKLPTQPALPPMPDGSDGVAVPVTLLRPAANTAYLAGFNGVLVTHDGGATWSHGTTPCPSSHAELAGITAGGPTMLWAVCSDGMGVGFEDKQLWRSTNSGSSWTGPSPLEGDGYSHEITALDSTTAWRYGGRGNLLHTSDAGRTWQVSLPDAFNGGFGPPSAFAALGTQDAWVFDPYGGYGTEDRDLYITADAGRTWRVVAVLTGTP